MNVEQGINHLWIKRMFPGNGELVVFVDEQRVQGIVFVILHFVEHSLDAAPTADAREHLSEVLKDFLPLHRQGGLHLGRRESLKPLGKPLKPLG